MSYYAIGIGGTGAKSIESLVHLCAAGMMPDNDELYILFVDPDVANGNLGRARITLQQYINCKDIQIGEPENISLFKTTISRADPDVWTPFGKDDQPSLDSFFQYSILKVKYPAAASLFDVLYTKAEKETPLDKGFRGHPSIGAAILAKTIQLDSNVEPWDTFSERIQADGKAGSGKAKIFLFGSIFGGTGASGFPTIARLVRNLISKTDTIRLGGALILPYFYFIPKEKNELKASSKNFLITTQIGLDYYNSTNATSEYYNAVYLFGDKSPSEVTFSIGAKDQENAQHFIELYAALSAIDFFKDDNANGYREIARRQDDKLEWGDLPDGNSGSSIKQKIGQLTRFAFAYLSVYDMMLDNINGIGHGYRSPWFINFFERKEDTNFNDNALQLSLRQLKDYCESYLRWIANIQTSARGMTVDLIKYNAFANKKSEGTLELMNPEQFILTDFSKLVLPEGKEHSRPISRLWEAMCDVKIKDSETKGVGRFIHALYRECAE